MSGVDVVFVGLGFLALGILARAAVLTKLFQLDCPHKTTTFPQRDRMTRRSYFVCLDCGKEFWIEADWINR